MDLNLVWQTRNGDETKFELDYITERLFSDFNQIRHFDNGEYKTVLNNSLIIYSNNQSQVSNEFLNYLNRFKENNYKFYLLHLSNENLSHNFSYYSDANHVFRNYYDSNINLENVTFVPLGVKSGFINKNFDKKKIENKVYDFAFIGQPKSDRFELISVLEGLQNVFLHKTNQWNCPTSLSQNQCIEIYEKTKFVPCPQGFTHPDSFRIMEVLESGSIPVLKNYNNLEYFNNVWGSSPIPIVNSWSEIQNLKNISDAEYFNLYDLVKSWYENTWNKIKEKINEVVNV